MRISQGITGMKFQRKDYMNINFNLSTRFLKRQEGFGQKYFVLLFIMCHPDIQIECNTTFPKSTCLAVQSEPKASGNTYVISIDFYFSLWTVE